MIHYITLLVPYLLFGLWLPVCQGADRPNVLFIAVDDMNDWVGPLKGHPQTKTPALDRLARMGETFTNAHCAAPACHPSRVAIMTGVRPSTSGIYRNVFSKSSGPQWREASLRLKDVVTLSQHFRNHGYRAVGGGKIYHALQWHRGSQNDPSSWDDYFPNALHPIPKWVRPKLIDDSIAKLTPGRPLGGGANKQLFGAAPLQVPDEKTSDYQVVDWAISELNKKHDKPLFIACGIFRPHIPWEVPQKYFDMYPLDKIQLPAGRKDDLVDAFDHGRRRWHRWVVENRQWKKLVQGYLASTSYADAQIGRLLDALKESGHADNTVIVLWTDHGMHIGEKDNWEKFTLWEESTRVPLFFVAPGVTRAGTRCNRPASLVDVYPTLCDLAGIPTRRQCEGTSLLPQLKDAKAPRAVPAITSYTFNRNRKQTASHTLRTDDWRYIVYANGMEEMYDHRTDQGEFTNLAYAEKHRTKLNELRGLAQKYLKIKTPTGHAAPAGYRLAPNGTIRRINYKTIAQIIAQPQPQRRGNNDAKTQLHRPDRKTPATNN